MPTYKFEALDTTGGEVKDSINALSEEEAQQKIKQMGYFVTKITEMADGKKKGKGKAAVKRKKRGKAFTIGGVSNKQLCTFTRQFSTLQDAGLPVLRSLKILEGQMRPGVLKNALMDVVDDVESGSTLSEAFSKHPKCFDRLYVNMVKAGEAGGVLDVILQRLASFMERMEALKRKIIGASIYPAVVITIAVAVVLAIMTFIVPKFQEVFRQVKVPMPGLTLMLMSISDVIKNYWWAIVAAPFVFLFVLKAWGRTKGGRMTIDRIKLNAPLIGPIIKKSVISRFCRTLGTLLQSGVPILEALAIVKNATGNEVVANAIATVHDSIREGESIAEPLAACGVFDDIVINMIDVGEETGELDKMLLKIADNYDAEVDAAVSALMSVMEPILIVGLGFTVGFIVVALFLPLISLLEGIGQKKH